MGSRDFFCRCCFEHFYPRHSIWDCHICRSAGPVGVVDFRGQWGRHVFQSHQECLEPCELTCGFDHFPHTNPCGFGVPPVVQHQRGTRGHRPGGPMEAGSLFGCAEDHALAGAASRRHQCPSSAARWSGRYDPVKLQNA